MTMIVLSQYWNNIKKGSEMLYKSAVLGLLASLILSFSANSSVILSPESVVDAPPTMITGFSFDRTIDQSGLTTHFISGETDFDAYVSTNPTHISTNVPQTHAFTSSRPDPYINIDYDLGAFYSIESLVFWNYGWPDSVAITGFNVLTSNTTDFSDILFGGSFRAVSDGDHLTRINQAQVFDLIDTTARYVRFQVTDWERSSNYYGTGFSEIAFGVTPLPVPVPGTVWLMGSGLIGLFACARRGKVSYASLV